LGTWGIGRICGEGRAEFVLLGRRNPQPGNFTAQDLISNPYFIITEGQEKPYTLPLNGKKAGGKVNLADGGR
jgi:hypothetical protein